MLSSKKNEIGQGMTEYIIIVALIAVAAIGVFRLFGDTVRIQGGVIVGELSGEGGDTAKQNQASDLGYNIDQASKNVGLDNFNDTAKVGGSAVPSNP